MIQDEARRTLTLAMRKQKEAEDHLVFLEQEFDRNRIKDLEILPVQEIHIRGAYNERLKLEVANQKEVIAKLQQEVEEARQAYIEATKEVEVLEKLKDKKHNAHNEMVAKLEEAFIDELVTQRARFSAIPKE